MMWASFGRSPPARAAARERVDVDPVGLQRDRVHARAALAQRQQRAVVGRPLDDHRVARRDELVEQERVGLHRAVGDDHASRRDAVLLGDPRAQRQVADRRCRRRSRRRGRSRTRAPRPRAGPRRRRCRATARRGRRRWLRLRSRRYVGSASDGSRCRQDAHRPQAAAPSAIAISATSVGVRPTRTPCASSASAFACGGAARAGDDRAGVTHRLARRGGEAGDVGDDRLGHVLGDVVGRLLLGVAADLARTSRSARSAGRPRTARSRRRSRAPGTGSPPIPTIELLPKPRWASSLPIW